MRVTPVGLLSLALLVAMVAATILPAFGATAAAATEPTPDCSTARTTAATTRPTRG